MKTIVSIALFVFSLWFFAACGGNNPSPEQENAPEQSNKEDVSLKRLDSLNRAIVSDSLNPELYKERSQYFFDQKDVVSAGKDIEKAISLDSLNPRLYVQYAKILFAENRLQKGVIALQRALELDNNDMDALMLMAEVSFLAGKQEDMLKYIDKGMKVNKLDPRPYYLRGMFWLTKKDTALAIKNFQQANFIDEDFAKAYVQLGLIYAARKNDMAIDYFNSAINAEPDNPDFYYALAMYYQNTGREEKAHLVYDQIVKKHPHYAKAYYNKGFLYLTRDNEYEKAVEYFSLAIEQNPRYAKAYYNRALSYLAAGDTSAAIQDLQRTLDINPGHEWAKEKLQELQ